MSCPSASGPDLGWWAPARYLKGLGAIPAPAASTLVHVPYDVDGEGDELAIVEVDDGEHADLDDALYEVRTRSNQVEIPLIEADGYESYLTA